MPPRKYKMKKWAATKARPRRALRVGVAGKNYRYKQTSKNWQKLGGLSGFGSVASPFPPNLYTVMTYSETLQHNSPGAGVPGVLQYRANGPFDPRVAVGGIQPRYYDSLLGDNGSTAPYRNYRVHACKIKVTIFQVNTAVGAGFVNYAIIPARSGITAPGTLDEMAERPYSRQISIAPSPSWKPQTIKHFCKIKTHLGHKDLTDVDASGALFNALPTEQVYWNLCLASIDNTTAAGIRVQVQLKYYVQLYSLADVADS